MIYALNFIQLYNKHTRMYVCLYTHSIILIVHMYVSLYTHSILSIARMLYLCIIVCTVCTFVCVCTLHTHDIFLFYIDKYIVVFYYYLYAKMYNRLYHHFCIVFNHLCSYIFCNIMSMHAQMIHIL